MVWEMHGQRGLSVGGGKLRVMHIRGGAVASYNEIMADFVSRRKPPATDKTRRGCEHKQKMRGQRGSGNGGAALRVRYASCLPVLGENITW